MNDASIFTPTARARIVEELYQQGVDLPQNLLSKAFGVLNEALEANQTKFFAYKGHVRQTEEIIDHTIRLAAAREVFTLAQMLGRAQDEREDTPPVAMEFDSNTGVLRLVVGNAPMGHIPITTVPLRNKVAPPKIDIPEVSSVMEPVDGPRVVLDEEVD